MFIELDLSFLGNMHYAQWASLLSAGLGAVGTAIMFAYSSMLEPLEGEGGPLMQPWNADIRAKNKVRRVWQKIGIGLLFCSFAVQFGAVFLP